MNKTKKIIGYILGFILTVLLVICVLLTIVKTTVLNESFIKNEFVKNNYYREISDKILENMKDYMRSSGLPEEILENIYTEADIKKDVNKYLDKIYKDEIFTVNTTELEEKMNSNIDKYLEANNLVISDKTSLEEFVTEMAKIYQNEVSLYNILNNYVNQFQKAINILNIALVAVILVCIVLFVTIILMKVRCLGSVTLASGLILLFIRFVIYEKVDFKNLLIISLEFSKTLRLILTKIANLIAICSYALIGIGIILAIIETYLIIKSKKHRHHYRSNNEKIEKDK